MESRINSKHNKCLPVKDTREWAGKELTTALTSVWTNLPGKAKDCEDKLCVKIFRFKFLDSKN